MPWWSAGKGTLRKVGAFPAESVCVFAERRMEHSGVTIYEASGGFTGEKIKELNVIVNRNEYAKIMKYLKSADPNTFTTITNIHDVMYRPKRISKSDSVK